MERFNPNDTTTTARTINREDYLALSAELVIMDCTGKPIERKVVRLPHNFNKLMKLAPPTKEFPPMQFDHAIHRMKQREERKHIIDDAARMLAAQMAAYMEDREGWHGERREQLIAEKESK